MNVFLPCARYARLYALLLGLTATTVLVSCASQSFTYADKLLMEADSLFQAGNYEYAKIRYTKLRDEYPNTRAGARAQYNLGYLNVYYDNPFASWEGALREFKRFASLHPDHKLIEEVNSWIRLLVVLRSFKRQYEGSTRELKELQTRPFPPKRKKEEDESYDVLLEAVRKCYSEKDTLLNKIRVLEDVISEIEKGP
jgi:tetratricopeptide (TPR) repeat protein